MGTGRGVEAYFAQASRLDIIDLAMALKKSQQVRHNLVRHGLMVKKGVKGSNGDSAAPAFVQQSLSPFSL